MRRPNQPREDRPRDTAYYAALVAAWFNTRLERDKSVLALSTAAVGLLVTLMMTVAPSTSVSLTIYVLGISAFAISIVTILIIFGRNASHLEAVMRNPTARDPLLSRLDRVSFYSFILGAVLLGLLGLMAGLQRVDVDTETNMSKTGASRTTSSDNGKRSFEGISNMRPSAAQPQTETKPSQSPATTTTPPPPPQNSLGEAKK